MKSLRGKAAATAVEQALAEAIGFGHVAGSNEPVDMAALLFHGRSRKYIRVGLDAKAAESQTSGVIGVNATAAANKLGFVSETMVEYTDAMGKKKKPPGYGMLSITGMIAVNRLRTVEDSGLFHLNAEIGSTRYENMHHLDVDGLESFDDLAKPEVMERFYDQVLGFYENIDLDKYREVINVKADENTKQAAAALGKAIEIHDRLGQNGKEIALKKMAEVLGLEGKAYDDFLKSGLAGKKK